MVRESAVGLDFGAESEDSAGLAAGDSLIGSQEPMRTCICRILSERCQCLAAGKRSPIVVVRWIRAMRRGLRGENAVTSAETIDFDDR